MINVILAVVVGARFSVGAAFSTGHGNGLRDGGETCTSGALLKFTSGVVMALQSLVTVMFSRILVVAVPDWETYKGFQDRRHRRCN